MGNFIHDVPFFSAVHQTMWHNLRKVYPQLQIGKYHHCADNIHYYERHFEIGDKILESEIAPPTFFYMKSPLFEFVDYEEPGNAVLKYSDDALAFESAVDEIVNSGEITHERCKEALKHLFIIQ